MSRIKAWNGTTHDELNERYTLPRYIKAAKEVMGRISLDPASCTFANYVVKAAKYYSEEDNGLTKKWGGHVWLNPPFRGGLATWIRKLIYEYKYGDVDEAIVLYPAASGVFSTDWFHSLLEFPLCIPNERISYYRQDGLSVRDHPPFCSLFSYLGHNEDAFIEVFGRYGHIMRAVDRS